MGTDKTTELLTRLVEQGAAREERLVRALERMAPTVHDPLALQTSIMTNLRGKNRPPRPSHHTTFTGAIVDPETAEPVRVAGSIELQVRSTRDGEGPLEWFVFALTSDDLPSEAGDLFRLVRGAFELRNADDLRRAEEDRAVHDDLTHRWSKAWRQAVYNRGRKVLINATVGRTIDQLGSIQIAEPPPALDAAPVAASSAGGVT